VLSFQLKSMDAWTDQNEDILFTIWDFDFRTSKVPWGNKKFNIKSSTGISFTSWNVNDDDLIEIKFSQGENGKIGIKVYVNNEELWYTSLSDHSLTYVKFDIGSKILFKKENIIDSDYNNSMMPELLKK
jgi:hypothetical protein